MNKVYLSIGGNMGDRLDNLGNAKTIITQQIGDIVHASSVYETAPWGMEDQPSFLNQVLLVETELTANKILKQILIIEEKLGRKRVIKFGPRVIDIDILFFNSDIINQPGLQIPHAEIQNRRFVLVPMEEIAASFIHPILKKTIGELLININDDLEARIYKVNP